MMREPRLHRSDLERLRLVDAPLPPLGETVTITEGPLRGLCGEVLDHSSQYYVILRVTAIRQAVRVHVPAAWVNMDRRVEVNRLPSDQKTKPHIVKPPGSLMMRFARFFFSTESVTEIFEPLYKDFWYEYEKAFVAEQKWKGRWIRVRYYWAFVKATGLVKFFSWIWDRVESVINKLA